MPTATSTVTKPPFAAQFPLKAGLKSTTPLPVASVASPSSPMAQTSTSATLRSLYTRAARAFVLRDITTTSSLLHSAFALLKPPIGIPDSLTDDRRKWDILRITFESTVYTSPSSSETLPESLRAIVAEAPQALATSIYTRSLSLFTPSDGMSQKSTLNAAFLPLQVLTTLVYCSLKLDAPDVGRVMIEDWIARREPRYSLDSLAETEGDGYGKVLELYCLHILPKLEQWDYAKEFLEYESELPSQTREHLKISLNNLFGQTMAARRPFKPSTTSLLSPTTTSPRSYSPAPSSSSSSSSSLSATSTHTIVPATPRGHRSSVAPSSLSSHIQGSSSSSISSDETATPRTAHASLSNGFVSNANANTNGRPSNQRSKSQSRTRSSASSNYSNLARSHHFAQQISRPAVPPSTYTLIRASLAPYLTSTKVTTFVLLFVLVPLISFVLRMRRRKRLMGLSGGGTGIGAATIGAALGPASMSTASNAEIVRRRLQVAGGSVETGLFMRAFGEVVRVVGDTVRMAGSGLV